MDEGVRFRSLRVEPIGSGGRAYTLSMEVEVKAESSIEAAAWLLSLLDAEVA